MSISSIGNDLPLQPQTESDRAQLNEDLDNFLLMLTTQLQNQDPLSPMDTTGVHQSADWLLNRRTADQSE